MVKASVLTVDIKHSYRTVGQIKRCHRIGTERSTEYSVHMGRQESYTYRGWPITAEYCMEK